MSEGSRIRELAQRRAESQRRSDRDDHQGSPRHADALLRASHAAPVLDEAERRVREIKSRKPNLER